MTFLTKLDDAPAGAGSRNPFGLSQHGRAGMEILGAIQQFAATNLRPQARAAFAADAEAQTPSVEHAADTTGAGGRKRIAAARAIADRDTLFRLERFLQRWVAEENFNTGIPAIEERRDQFERFMAQSIATPAGGTLDLAKVEVPKYYEMEWHLEPGGWDGWDLYGPLFAFAVGPMVFSKGGYAAVGVGDDITQQRVQAVRQFPKSSYRRVYEPGCGGATTFKAINTVFPDAELVGCDLSPLLLTNGHKMAERQGVAVHLKQRDATATGEPDASFDAVITYALHHELPPKENAAMFREMYRILEPGGDIVLSDPPPFRAVDLFHAVILDWDTDNREEPFFSTVLHTSLDDQLRDAGFVNVESYAIGQDQYPWITPRVEAAGDGAGGVTDATMPAESMDDLSRIVMALVQEVWVMRDRMAVTEQLLAERANISAADIDDYAGGAPFKRDLEKLRDRFTAKVIGAPLAARERSVEQILARAGLSSVG